MDFRLSEEQEFIRDTASEFVARKCPRDVAREVDERCAFPAELLRDLAQTGFLALNSPDEFGGGGPNLLGTAVVTEELARMSPTLAGAYPRVALWGGKVIADLGSREQQERYLPGLAEGAVRFTCAGLDPIVGGAGSGTRATRNEDTYVLSGEDAHVPLARLANVIIVPAAFGGTSDTVVLLVDTAAAGIRITETESTGFRGLGTARVAHEGTRVPVANVLGGPEDVGHGSEQRQALVSIEQIEAAALGLGMAQGAYDYAVAYAKERVQFGQPIVRFEVILTSSWTWP